MKDIHWFPGHMNKAMNEIKEKISLVDIVLVVLDARAPFSSCNKNLSSIIANKRKIALFSKYDLCDKDFFSTQIEQIKDKFDDVLSIDILDPSSKKLIHQSINKVGQYKRQKEKAKGMKPQPIRVMIVGIPNVGKSSLINRLGGKKLAGVANRPAFTRGDKWINVNDFILLDTPGVLPMSYENKHEATVLALLGSIKEDILPSTDLCIYLIDYFKKYYPSILNNRFGISEIVDYHQVMNDIAKRRGILVNDENYSKVENILLKETKDGLIGSLSFEKDGVKI
ncbi:MAG: ribosome biogenesis GTPase YlqF [Bacilli bacterium]